MKKLLRALVLMVLWGGVGALLVGIVGMIATGGTNSRAVLPLTVGLILVFGVGPIVLVLSGLARATGLTGPALKHDPEAPLASVRSRAIARVESIRQRGVVLGDRNHLYDFTVTAFARAGQPQLVTFSQLITMGQLPNFYTGRYVVLATLDDEHGTLRLDPDPGSEWRAQLRDAPEKYDLYDAPAPIEAPPVPTAVPAKPGALKVFVNLAIVALCIAAGGLASTLYVFGSIERATLAALDVPQRVSGAVTGTWNSRQLDLDMAALSAHVGDREVVQVLLLDTFISINAVSETDSQGIDTYAMRSGFLEESWSRSRASFDVPFDVSLVSADTIRDVVQRVTADLSDDTIGSVMIMMRDEGLVMNVTIDGKYGSHTREFNAITGDEITQS